MGQPTKIGYWDGKPAEELTREELLQLVAFLSREVEHYTLVSNLRAAAMGKVEMMKRRRA